MDDSRPPSRAVPMSASIQSARPSIGNCCLKRVPKSDRVPSRDPSLRHSAWRLRQSRSHIGPLRVEEPAEIFAVEFDAVPNLTEWRQPENTEQAVLSICSTLITVVKDNGPKFFQISHCSVKEYLISDLL